MKNRLLTTKTSQESTRQNKSISIEDISPELAAQIVRQYILPMFDTKSKQTGSMHKEFLLAD